jgi:hypothetical protein
VTKKIVGIETAKKVDEPCPFCGARPACPDWTCKRLASVTVDEAGWSVEFVPLEPTILVELEDDDEKD